MRQRLFFSQEQRDRGNAPREARLRAPPAMGSGRLPLRVDNPLQRHSTALSKQMTLGPYNGFSGEERERVAAWKRSGAKDGRYTYPTKCSACGQTKGRIDGHLEDYSPPFSQSKDIPLCARCHLMVHARLRWPDLWASYRAQVRAGRQCAPLKSRSSSLPPQEWEWSASPDGPPRHYVLDEIHEGRLCPPGRIPGNPVRGRP